MNHLNLLALRRPPTTGLRQFHASNRLSFKFKFTEEMAQKYEEEQAAKEKPKLPQLAQHTKSSPLIMAKVNSERFNKVVKVSVPKHTLNQQILLYIRERDDILALDEHDQAKPGDWVLLRRQEQPLDDKVQHKVDRVVHQYGKYIEPMSGRRSFGLYYDDDFERLEKIKLDK